MPAKFTLYTDKAGKFRFNLKAVNGEIIATGESYPDKKSALKGIASIAKNAPVAKIEDTTVDAAAKKAEAKPAKAPKSKAPAKPGAAAKAKAPAKPGTAAKPAPKPRGRKPKASE